MVLHRRISFWVFLFLAALVSFFVLRKVFSSVQVKTASAVRQTLTITVTATSTGTIKSDKEVKVTAERTGIISRVFVEEGEAVKAGSMIAELDSKEADINLKMSEAAIRKAQAGLTEIKTAFEPVRVEVDTNIQKAAAALKDSENRLKRFKELIKKGYISQMELDSAEKDYEIARANHEAAVSGKEQLKAKAEEIKAREAMVEESMSSLSMAKLNYGYSFIKAPITGAVTSRPVKLGETVPKGGLIAAVVAMDSLYIESFIDEADVAAIKAGQEVIIAMDAYPDKKFKGDVYMISPVVLGGKQEARTFEVRTRIKDTAVVLKPGMSADVEIVIKGIENALVIPSQAVMEKEGEYKVYVKKGSNARLLRIKPGLSNWTYTEVAEGIKEGDAVIVNPDAAGLKDGSRISVQGK